MKKGGIWATGSTSSAITSSAFADLISAITDQISVETVVEVLAYAAGISIGLVFLWWAGRKAVRMLMAAFRKGRISV